MRSRWWYGGLVAVALAGCSDNKPDAAANRGPTPEKPAEPAAAKAQPELLKPLVMDKKPGKAMTVWEVFDRKEGETVVVSGRVPPEKVKPFNDAVAAFILMAPEDLDREDIKEEFDCDDAAT
jgi:hypothetical protein